MAEPVDALEMPLAFKGVVENLACVSTADQMNEREGHGLRWTPANTLLPDDEATAWLFRATGVSTQLADRSADLRALITAYSQAVASDRPELAQLAKWQRISPSALRHRYDESHVQSVHELLKDDPLIDIVIEPLVSVIDDDLSGVTPALDEQLKLRHRMRELAAEEFDASFGSDASRRLGFPRNPADARITRPIADLGSFMTRTLENRAPDLLPVFEDWQRRFEARDIKPVDSNAKTTRVRRPKKA